MTDAKARPRGARLGRRIFTTIVLSLVLVEIGARVATHSLFRWSSADDRDAYRDLDPLVGYVPKSGVTVHPPKGHFTITTLTQGTRSHGQPVPTRTDGVTLVTGDSFAFGDDVDDSDSWPAALERLRRRRVVNAGVPGFGLDQAVLRAKEMATDLRPNEIVVGFIPHDVTRCEMSWWSGNPKPTFDLEDGVLHYRPAPVMPRPLVLSIVKSVLSKSVAVDTVAGRWLHWGEPDTFVHHRGREVACALMGELANLGRDVGARVSVVGMPQKPESSDEDRATNRGVLACAADRGLLAIDAFPAFDALTTETRAALFHGHYTPAGNQMVAAIVNERLGP